MSKPKLNPRGSYAGHVTGRFECPHGHDVGAVAVMSDGVVRHLAGAEWIDTPDGGKLRLTCKLCVRAGRRLDLQANWSRVVAELRTVEPDPMKAVCTVRVGGRVA